MNESEAANVLRALASPTRLRLLTFIRDVCEGCDCPPGDSGVTAMAEHANISQPTASHHLRELRAAGLVTVERAGQSVCCALNRDRIAEISRFLGELSREVSTA